MYSAVTAADDFIAAFGHGHNLDPEVVTARFDELFDDFDTEETTKALIDLLTDGGKSMLSEEQDKAVGIFVGEALDKFNEGDSEDETEEKEPSDEDLKQIEDDIPNDETHD